MASAKTLAAVGLTVAATLSCLANAALVPELSFALEPIVTPVCSASASAVFDPTLQECSSCPQYLVSGSTCPVLRRNVLSHMSRIGAPSTLTIGNTTIRVCACSQGEYVVDRDVTGLPLSTATCSACPSGFYPSVDLSTCLACPDINNMVATLSGGSYSCSCKTGGGLNANLQGGLCVADTAVSRVITTYGTVQSSITYQDVVDSAGQATSLTVQSDLFNNNYVKAISKCDGDGDVLSCQLLANLCVLSMYDQSSRLCAAYLKLAKARQSIKSSPYDDQPFGLPWLYYGTVNRELPQTTRNRIPGITLDVSGGAGVSSLPFVLGVYRLNGSFVGFQNLTTELQLCQSDPTTMSKWRKVAHNYITSCTLNLSNFLAAGYETYFYELFLLETSGSLYPIPVRITNYRSTAGTLVNANPSAIDWSNNQLVRRFFIVDTVSGISSGSLNVIRIPTSISIWIYKATNQAGKILLPILDMTYTERDVSTISKLDSSKVSSPTVQFSVYYDQDSSYLRQVLTILLVIVVSAGIIYAFYLARLWNSRNLGPYDSIDVMFVLRFLLTVCECLGPLLGIFVYVVCLYFFVFFKAQSLLFICLPYAPADVSVLMTAVAGVAAAEMAFIVRYLARQCSAQVFFIDWERSKGRVLGAGSPDQGTAASAAHSSPLSPMAVSGSAASAATSSLVPSPVSVWRSIFMANQWNTLQTYRRVHIEFTLIMLLVLLEGLELRNLATERAGLRDISSDALSPILVVAVDTTFWLLLVVVQLIVHGGFYARFYRNKLLQYIDILSLANVSLVLFDTPSHGYYIHGRSVHAVADTNMEELNGFLRKEANDMVPRRGLQDTHQQSFEVFVTLKTRATLDKLYEKRTASPAETIRTNRMVNRLTIYDAGGGGPSAPIKPASEPMLKQYKQINKFLKSFLDQNLKDVPYTIRERTYFERFLTSPDPSEGNVFFPNELGFARSLLYGLEMHMLLAYAFLFAFADLVTGKPVQAAVAVWIVDSVLVFLRRHFGEMNLSQKTLLDWKFLV
ncbi:Meckelin [Entophlyctis helioformis]|nr:Meckelin [Entophlyctis helioformis]